MTKIDESRSRANAEDATNPPLSSQSAKEEPYTVQASDGCVIKGFYWRHSAMGRGIMPVVVINPATSVRCRYYFRFATFLFEHGFDVMTYDYRGIGESRPATLRGFDVSWIDWGRLDFDAVLRYAKRSFEGQQICVVAHSVGGFVLGLANSNYSIHRIFTVGAQFAYWRDYASSAKLRMLAKWHVVMPLATMLFGYFPGKRFGWLEDTPRGIVRDWVFGRPRFEDTWRGGSAARYLNKQELVHQFAAVTAPILALSVTDDEFGTVPAVERLLSYFRLSPRKHLRVSPDSIAEPTIGHFGFFNSRVGLQLWPVAVQWLESGNLPSNCPGVIISDRPHNQFGRENV